MNFAFKKIAVKNKLLSRSIGENEKNWKNDYAGKNILSQFFSSFIKKNWVPHKSLRQEKCPKIRFFWCNGSFFNQNCVIKLEKIDMASPDFKCNSQHCPLFNKVPVCTKYPKDLKPKTWIFCIILDPCSLFGIEIHSFAIFWTVLQNP